MSNSNDPEQSPPSESADGAATGDPDAADATASAGGRAAGGAEPRPEALRTTVRLNPDEIAQLGDEWPTDPDDPLVGTLLRNKWRVLGRIGSGSFGTVYKVKDVNGEWIEALKILSVDRLRGPDADNVRKRFLREAQIMKRLGSLSPHIVGLSTYEDDVDAGLIYFLMEHVEGRILSEVLLHDGPLSLDRTIRIGLQVCDALIAAHESEEPVVHRDLKLENIMLTTDRTGRESIKVLDFGIAKIAVQEQDSRLTGAGSLGTPGYAAPEQLRAGKVDGRTDLFAFGVILYSLVTGRNPWLGHLAYQPTNQTYELMAASDRAEVIPIADTGVEVPPRMVAIIMKLLQREPSARFQSARELRDALLDLGGGQTTTGGLEFTRELHHGGGSSHEPERRLAAVWFADLVGYSTLSSQDEEAALALLDIFHKTARRVIEGGGGRVVQFIGDAAFAEFSSTQRAVGTAKDFLEAFAEDTAPFAFQAQLRIGVHVGDVLMAADGDLFGDGVNIAARIQNEAEPGQILVSQDVWRQLRQRRDFGFLPIGERTLKGIGSPVSLFAVVEAGEVVTTGELERGLRADTTTGLPAYPGAAAPGSGRGRGTRIAAGVLLLAAVGAAGYWATGPGASAPTSEAEPASPVVGVPDPATSASGGAEPVTDNGGEADTGDAAEPDGGVPREPIAAESSPTTAAAPPAAGGGSTTAAGSPSTTPAAPAEDPFRSRYDGMAPTALEMRRQAGEGIHPGARAILDDGEEQWGLAASAASAGRYQEAFARLEGAMGFFGAAMAESDILRSVDAARSRVDEAREDAVVAVLIRRADGLVADAERAVADRRYPDAIDLYGRAETTLVEARTEEPAPPPVVVPAEVAADVLARLEAAIEARDLPRVRQVWTSISNEQAQGFTRSFGAFRQFEVDFAVGSVTRDDERIVTDVVTTYHIDGNASSTAQTFEMAERGGTWVIVADRVTPGRE